MNTRKSAIALGLALAAFGASAAHAASIKLTFDYMATNLKGDFATASGGTAVPVAELFLVDHADLGVVNPEGGNSGVRAVFRALPGGLSQFSSGTGSVYISAFELNFPNTSTCSNATCGSTGEINGYDSDANGGMGNRWTNVHGVPLAGGIEWAENGATNGWGSGTTDPSFQQEYNWGNTGIMNETAGLSIIDIFSGAGRTDVSVANIIGNPVVNSANGALPNAFSWIKIRSNNSADPSLRGIEDTGTWWGTPALSGAGVNQRYQLNVLATGYENVAVSAVPVPEPGEYLLMASGLGVLALARRRFAKQAAA